MNKYLEHSWINPSIELRRSPIEGAGIFAKKIIKKGEVVIVWGSSTLLTEAGIKTGKYKVHTNVQIGEDLYLAEPPGGSKSLDDFTNHSCNPKLWMKDETTLISRRIIEKGEEVTIDYSMFMGDPGWRLKHECRCGSELCRKIITGEGWKIKELQKRYRGHFSPYINERIKKMGK